MDAWKKWAIGLTTAAIALAVICTGGGIASLRSLFGGSDDAEVVPTATATDAPTLAEEVVYSVPSGTAGDTDSAFMAISAGNAVCDPVEGWCRVYDTRDATWGHGLFVEGVEPRGVCSSRNGGAALCLVAKATGKVVSLDCLPTDPRVASVATADCPAFTPSGARLPDAIALGDETPASD